MATPDLDEAAIFNAARQIESPEARRQYLQGACGGDPELQRRVEALLGAHDEPPTYLASPTDGFRELLRDSAGEGPGTPVGPYTLLQAIGEGGMGTVFLAEQTQPVQRQVAVKVIRSAVDSPGTLARFEAERQALALMDHPNIAKILDAGETRTGRPYFVMELIRGVPITRYCDEQRLSLRERLELFLPVCRAVQHAHLKGVIHRDLKPTNVLVPLYDGKPVPKVIDFGIAKATGVRLTEQTVVTQFGSVVGTLEYMSPEQAGTGQLDIDTRSDVYSLGVLLYELLTGTTPLYPQQREEAGLLDLLCAIREEEPPRPSTRLSTTEELAVIAANRGVEPKKLPGLVQGDLDWIVMKCLEKDRSRRYETASALARDLERYLNEEPVEACPPSAGYRLRKFARKNRKLLLGATAFVLVLAAAAVVSAWQAVLARAAEQRALDARDGEAEQRELAEQSAKESAAVLKFFRERVLAAAAPKGREGGLGKDATIRAALDQAEPQIAKAFADQPLIEAEIRNTLAVTYDRLGEHAQAEVHAKRARELFANELGPEDIRSLNAATNLANTLKGQRRLDDARKLYEEVLEVARRAFGPDHHVTLGAMNNLAVTLTDLGHWDEALKLHEEALEVRRRVNGPDHHATLQSMNNLAVLLRTRRQYDKARKLHEETLRAQIRVLGPEDPETLGSMHNVAFVLSLQGEFAEAVKRYEQVLEAESRILGTKHPARLQAMNELAWIFANAPDPKFRDPRRAVELAKEVAERSHGRPDLWYRLGVAYYRAGELKNAITALDKSAALAPEQSVAYCGFFLAMARWKLGEKETAREQFNRAAEWVKKNKPSDQGLLRSQVEAYQLLGLPEPPAPVKQAGK
jgi:serine/threonine protein kinase/Flp pilus assembly protein TadD